MEKLIYEYEPVIKVNKRKGIITLIRQIWMGADGTIFERNIAGYTFNEAYRGKA